MLLGINGAALADAVTIRMPSWWFGEPANNVWLKDAIAAFETQNPNIKIEGYNVPYDSYADQMLAEIAAGSPPDIIHLLNLNIGDFMRNDLLEPMDALIDKDAFKADNYNPAQFAAPIVKDGKTYGVIHMIANYLPFYNKSLLKAAGFEEFPSTPEEFSRLVTAMTKSPEVFGYAAMVKPGSYVETYMDVALWVIANGGGFAKNGQPTVNSQDNIAAITAFKKLFDAGVMPRDVDKSTYRQMWWEGKVGVLFDGAWMMSFAKSNNPSIVENLDTALMPWPSRRTASAFQIWSIPRGAKHPAEAAKFIQFLQSADWQRKMVEQTNAVSPRIGATPADYLAKNPWFKNFEVAADKYAVSIMPEGLEVYGNEVVKIIADQIEEILYANADITNALNDAQAQVAELVKSK
jgi:multiple sugar transport system substrate-binding protein